MLKKLLDISGSMTSALSGAFGMSEQHRQFLSNGWKCPHCNERLMNAVGVVTANFYAADGSRMSKWAGGGLRADLVECPKCSHRWKMYGDSAAVQPTGTEVIEIIETERREEFFGEDRRVIDNSKNSGSPTRSFSFSKEWSKTFHVEVERAKSGGAELSLGAKDAGALRLSSEEKLRRTYSVSADTKETSTEDVSCQAPAYRKLTVVVRWKRIWQHGIVVAVRDGEPLHIPFRVAVGVTFDQQQIEEDGSSTTGPTSI
jgi:DNA-directed RNA polymerase subunit RPC12/RpoP